MSWASFASALGGASGGALGAGLQYASAKKLQEDAQQFQTSFYKQRYQRQMEDMRAAGLNPILSYKTGAGGTAGGSIASTTGISSAIASGAQAGAAGVQATSAAALRKEQVKTEKAKQQNQYSQSVAAMGIGRAQRANAEITESYRPEAMARFQFDYDNPAYLRELRRAQLIGGGLQQYGGAVGSLIGGTAKAIRNFIPRRAPDIHKTFNYGRPW